MSYCNISLNGEELKAVDKLRYLGVKFCKIDNGKAKVAKSCKGEEL